MTFLCTSCCGCYQWHYQSVSWSLHWVAGSYGGVVRPSLCSGQELRSGLNFNDYNRNTEPKRYFCVSSPHSFWFPLSRFSQLQFRCKNDQGAFFWLWYLIAALQTLLNVLQLMVDPKFCTQSNEFVTLKHLKMHFKWKSFVLCRFDV